MLLILQTPEWKAAEKSWLRELEELKAAKQKAEQEKMEAVQSHSQLNTDLRELQGKVHQYKKEAADANSALAKVCLSVESVPKSL